MTGSPNLSSIVAGVELGGTKCVATLGRGGEIVEQQTVPTTSPDETLGALRKTLQRWWNDRGFEALGVASFGPVDLVSHSPTYGFITTTAKQQWAHADILSPLTRRFPVPLGFDTDVNAAALAEIRWGAGRELDDFAYITVGTGVGVGLIVNGRPVHGFSHPELGHIRVARRSGDDWPGACPFHGDCVEGLASGASLEARLQGISVSDLPADDPVWDLVADPLAQLCHVLVCGFAPRRIVLGGGVLSKQPHLLLRIEQMLVDSMAGYLSLPGDGPYLGAPALGERAGPLGSIAIGLTALAHA